MSRNFAGYSSVALETIWLHEPRDLIFLGPFMTLLCLRYGHFVEYMNMQLLMPLTVVVGAASVTQTFHAYRPVAAVRMPLLMSTGTQCGL